MPYSVENKIQFLSEAGRILSSTLDYNVTLVSIAKLLVESVADFCIIDVLENGEMNRVVVRTSKKTDQVIANKFFNFPPDPRNKLAIYDAAASGSPILIQKATPGWLKSVSRIKEERSVVEELQLNSFIFAPLKSRGKVIGVLTIGSSQKDFSYSEEDVDFISELASRAALAVDNSKLFSEVEEALHARDDFLSIASHELKTPLTSILLALQFSLRHLKEEERNSKNERIINALQTGVLQTRRLSALINDLLNISVIKTGRVILDKEESDLIGIIKDAILGFKLLVDRKKIKITFKNKDDVIIGMWDKIRMGEVFSNLISNSIKYGKNKPIIIEAKASRDKVVVKITDKGIGIDKKDIKNIFDIFRRTKEASEYKGMGVGLYITNQIVTIHGGTIHVKSTPQKGTTFTIELVR